MTFQSLPEAEEVQLRILGMLFSTSAHLHHLTNPESSSPHAHASDTHHTANSLFDEGPLLRDVT